MTESSVCLSQNERLTEAEVCRIFCQLTDAVQYIHQRDVVHCAITSHAIQLVSTVSAKLTNFEYAARQDKLVVTVVPCLFPVIIIRLSYGRPTSLMSCWLLWQPVVVSIYCYGFSVFCLLRVTDK